MEVSGGGLGSTGGRDDGRVAHRNVLGRLLGSSMPNKRLGLWA